MTSYMNRNFANKLLRLLGGKNITARELADGIDVPVTNVYNWTSGKRMPKLETLISISDFFGVSVDSLVKKEGVRK